MKRLVNPSGVSHVACARLQSSSAERAQSEVGASATGTRARQSMDSRSSSRECMCMWFISRTWRELLWAVPRPRGQDERLGQEMSMVVLVNVQSMARRCAVSANESRGLRIVSAWGKKRRNVGVSQHVSSFSSRSAQASHVCLCGSISAYRVRPCPARWRTLLNG